MPRAFNFGSSSPNNSHKVSILLTLWFTKEKVSSEGWGFFFGYGDWTTIDEAASAAVLDILIYMIKAAVLWIVNEEHEILLAQRAHHKAQDPGVWGTAAAGKLEPGESFDDAVVREAEEELGLTTADYTPKFLFEKDFTHPDGEPRKFGIYYAILPKAKSSLIRVDANEVAGFGWFARKTIEEKMRVSPEELVPSANALWPEILSTLKSAGVL